MMRSAPICLAESTPMRPTAPSPTTTTVVDPAAPRRRRPQTSRCPARPRPRAGSGRDRRRAASAVGTSVPSASGTRRRRGPGRQHMNSRCSQEDWKPCLAVRAGVVREAERADDELAGPYRRHVAPTSLTMPQYSWPMCVGSSTGCKPAVGPEVGAADAGGREPDDRVGRLLGSSARRHPRSGRRAGRTGRWQACRFPSACSGAVVGVADVFHPIDDLAIVDFLDGDVGHAGRR